MQDTTENYIHLEKVSKIYGTKEVKIIAVDEISFHIAKGEFAVIVGPSGAGKTTVLNILGGMDTATEGGYRYQRPDLGRRKEHWEIQQSSAYQLPKG